jgi:hypothetical protein
VRERKRERERERERDYGTVNKAYLVNASGHQPFAADRYHEKFSVTHHMEAAIRK